MNITSMSAIATSRHHAQAIRSGVMIVPDETRAERAYLWRA